MFSWDVIGWIAALQAGKSLIESLAENRPFGWVNEDRALCLNVVLLHLEKLASSLIDNSDHGGLFVKNGLTFRQDGPLGWSRDDVHGL